MDTKVIPLSAMFSMSLDSFAEHTGITRATAWRWRKPELLKTINIYGRQYVPREVQPESGRRRIQQAACPRADHFGCAMLAASRSNAESHVKTSVASRQL